MRLPRDLTGRRLAGFLARLPRALLVIARWIALPRLAEELKKLRASRPEATSKERVFLNREGEPWKDMRRAWKRTLRAAGLDGVKGLTPYSCRHTFATHFLSNGGAITDLQGQLGHSDISTTNIYARLVDARRKKTVFAMDFETGDGVAEGRRARRRR